MEKVHIKIGNAAIDISKRLFDLCTKEGLDLNGEYGDKILNLVSPHIRPNNGLIIENIYNAYFEFCHKKRFGRFVQYMPDGKKRYSNDLFELVKDSYNLNCFYTFEKFDEMHLRPVEREIDFFGLKTKVNTYKNMNDEPRPYMINMCINDDVKFCKKLAKGNEEIFNKDLEWRLFALCRVVNDWNKDYKQYRNRINDISESEYNAALTNILARYSRDQSLFERVDQLSKYKNDVGIYVICLKNTRRIYVGQAKTSLAKRISQHINAKSSGFDYSFFPEDIDTIYVLKTPKDVEMVNRIEADCIATIGPRISTNVLGSSKSLTFIKDESYNPNDFILRDKQIKQYCEAIAKNNQS